jgi:hypothetical protein
VRAMRQTFPHPLRRPAQAVDARYVCDRAHGYRGEPNCQSFTGPPIDKAIGMLIAEQMTPTAVELTLDIRREIEVWHEEA